MELPKIHDPATMTERYFDAYCAAARMRLSTLTHARLWWSLGVSAQTAGAWARYGYTPQEAWPLIDAQCTPQAAAARDGRLAA